jgi:hypothetical protein
MTPDQPYDAARAAFTEADTRFQQALSSAFAAHTQGVAAFFAMLRQVEQREGALTTSVAELTESVAELKALILEQGGQITDLRQRLDARGAP